MIQDNKLNIFEDFQKIPNDAGITISDNTFIWGGTTSNIASDFTFTSHKPKLKNWFRRLWLRWHNRRPIKFYEDIKKSYVPLTEFDFEGTEKYLTGLREKFKESHQVVLTEQLDDEINRLRAEIKLYLEGFNVFIPEESIVELFKSAKGFRMDWIKNYALPLPKVVYNELQRATEINVFENFVVLHYDPTGKNSKLTKKEVEAKKDPILFGIMKSSRRLYYIADWITEDCDLTLEKLCDLVAKSPEEITNTPLTILNEIADYEGANK